MLGGMTLLTVFFAVLASFNFVWLLPLIGPQGTLAATLLSLLAGVLTRRFLRARYGLTPLGRARAYGFLLLFLFPLMLAGLLVTADLASRLIFLLADIVLAVYWWDKDRWTGLKKRASSWAGQQMRRFSRPVMGH